MATVALETVVVSLASDLTQALALDVPGLTDSQVWNGEVRPYANGVERSVTRAGGSRSVPLEPDWMTAEELETLESWATLPLLFRDPKGRKFYGVFFALDAEPYIVNDMAKVSFTVQRISLSEEV